MNTFDKTLLSLFVLALASGPAGCSRDHALDEDYGSTDADGDGIGDDGTPGLEHHARP